MLTERQIRGLLNICENRTGVELTGLRKRLLYDKETFAHIWELVVLFAVTGLGHVIPEPYEGAPDTHLNASDGKSFWMEAAFITNTHKLDEEEVDEFGRWIRKRLHEAGCLWGKTAHIDIEVKDDRKEFHLPRRNGWLAMTKEGEWRKFINQSLMAHSASWISPRVNFTVEASARDPKMGSFVTMHYPGRFSPNDPTEHPVYRTIREKAKRWVAAGKDFSPLVLVIGYTQQHSIIDPSGGTSVSLRQAVNAAFTDPKLVNNITYYNWVGCWGTKSMKVSGSELISAVVLAGLNDAPSPLYRQDSRIWKARFYDNPHARRPLSSSEMELLSSFNLNRVDFGRGFEEWSASDKGDQLQRAEYKGGRLMIRPNKDGSFIVEIPVHHIIRVLAGAVSAKSLFLEYGADVPELFVRALRDGQEIVDISLVDQDLLARTGGRIQISFGPPHASVLCVPKRKQRAKSDGP